MTNLCYGLFELILVVCSILLIINFANDEIDWFNLESRHEFREDCLRWISVYGALYAILFIRRMVNTCQWIYQEDPRDSQANCNCLTFVFLNTFEIGWFIYGNTIFFGSDGLNITDDNLKLWKVMFMILIWGYLNMIMYIATICGICFIITAFYAKGMLDPNEMKEYD